VCADTKIGDGKGNRNGVGKKKRVETEIGVEMRTVMKKKMVLEEVGT
jgi:hypothetical protein